ncbi:tRNA threonylcarbamoyladenosine dehydratase [Paludibacter sp.]
MQKFQRTELLLGKSFLQLASQTKVILFGIGGVGSWCAEALIRAGVGNLTIVDSDVVNETNINRQILATTKTIGQAKTEVLKERLLEINPQANVNALQMIFCEETCDYFDLKSYDYIVDAIDSLSNKAYLIQQASKTDAILFSSMGAALKTDPTRVKVNEFWKVHGCPLASALRRTIRKTGGVEKKFLCVFSDEIFENKGEDIVIDKTKDSQSWDTKKVKINGTVSYMPAMFGLTLSALITQSLIEKLHY